MSVFKQVREFFWPLLEKGEPPTFEELIKDNILVDNSFLPEVFRYTLDCYNREEERRKGIESKSSLFIGTISVVTSVILGVASILVKENNFDMTVSILVFLLFILTLYMSRTVWFSIKALERKNYYSISVSDFLIKSAKEEYYIELIVEIANKIERNAITINNKVDNMTMAQEYFKRAIVVVALCSFVILILFFSKSEINMLAPAKGVILWNINFWNIVALYILSITSLILSIIAVIKKKRV